MEKAAILQKTVDTLSPFETGHLLETMRHLTVKGAVTNPWFIGAFLVIAFYAIVVRSKFVLCALFTALSLLVLFHYTMPAEGDNFGLSTTIPFAFGGLAIGGVLIYFYFIKTE